MSEHSVKVRSEIRRLYALGLLRGLCAIGVASYHFAFWNHSKIPLEAAYVLSIFGTYGVSIFFALSGYSLAHVYDERFSDRIEVTGLGKYVRRRYGRLAPMFIAAVAVSLWGKWMVIGKVPDWGTTAANAALLFGFSDPSATPVIGGWSIGVEVCFYLVLPLLMLWRRAWLLITGCAIFLTAWISHSLQTYNSLEQGWSLYVQPANHLIFFCSGIFMRLHGHKLLNSRVRIGALLLILSSASIVLCGNGSELLLVSGWRRGLLIGASLGIVAAFSCWNCQSGLARRFCRLLGDSSYVLYLLHPILYFTVRRWLGGSSPLDWFVLIAMGIGLAVAIDKWVDAPIQNRAKAIGW